MFVLPVFVLVLFCVLGRSLANKNPFGEDKPKPPSIDSHKGVVALDVFTFPKIVPHASQTVVVLVYQKALVGDYGTDSFRHDYFTFADKANVDPVLSESVLFAQVIVNGAFNTGLAKSFGLKADFEAPALFLFAKGSSYPIRYPIDQTFSLKSLTRFVKEHLDSSSEVAGLVKPAEEFVSQFFAAPTAAERVAVTAALQERLIPSLGSDSDRDSAAYYVKVMKKLGDELVSADYLTSEVTRLENTLTSESKMSEKSRRGITEHLNVLKLFRSKREEAERTNKRNVVEL